MSLFKCRDCGYDVNDPVAHVCGPPPSGRSNEGGRYDKYDDSPYSPEYSQPSRYREPPPRSPYIDYPRERRGYDLSPSVRSRDDNNDRYTNNAYDNRSDRRANDRYDNARYHNDLYDDDRYSPPINGNVTPTSARDLPTPRDVVSPPKSPSPVPEASSNSPSPGFGLGFLTNYTKGLFGSSSNNGVDDKDIKSKSDANVHNLTNKLDDAKLEDDYRGPAKAREETMYTTSSVGPRDTTATIDLSEIMLYKDSKPATCIGCGESVLKGDEIVCISTDIIHATCTVCHECNLTADQDPYGSDGWKAFGSAIVCADCLARDPMAASGNYGPSSTSHSLSRDDVEVCDACNLSIINSAELVKHSKLKGAYHAKCLVCQYCSRGIDETFNPDNPIHVRKGRPLCHPCYLQTLPRCGGCRNVITRDTRVCAALGRKYHPQCFNCFKCNAAFPDKSFYVLKDQPYCRWCYHEENGTICTGCQKPIEGPCACVVEGRFHPDCLVCATCRDPLTDVYYSYEGKPYCEPHIIEIQRRRGGKAERRQTYYRNM